MVGRELTCKAETQNILPNERLTCNDARQDGGQAQQYGA